MMITIFTLVCMFLAINVNSQVPTSYVCVKHGIGNTNSSSSSSVVYVAVVDSTMIDSITGITQNSAVVHVKFFFGALSDTISITLSDLLKNSQYICKASILTDTSATTVESSTKTFMTLQCGYIPTSGHVAKNPCTDSVWVKDIPTGSTVQWIKGTSNFSTQPCFLTTQSGNYLCIVTDPTGCTMTTSPIVVNITGLTAITSGDVVICKGTSTELSVSTNATGEVLYKWTPTTGLSDPNIANPVASPTNTITYTVTLTSGACSAISSGLKVTVNVNNTVASLKMQHDSACNKAAEVDIATGLPSGGDYHGPFMFGNYFIPDTSFVGPSQVTYTVTDNNGCESSASKTVWVIDSPVVDTMYYLGNMFVVEGWIPYEISLHINKTDYPSFKYSKNQVLFDGVNVSDAEGVVINSSVGGCFLVKTFHRFGLGVSDIKSKLITIKKGEKVMLINMLGQIVSTQYSPNDLNSEFEVYNLFKSAGVIIMPENIYLFRSENGAFGKIPIVAE